MTTQQGEVSSESLIVTKMLYNLALRIEYLGDGGERISFLVVED